MLYDSTYWRACPNVLVKSRIYSTSYLRIACKELMSPRGEESMSSSPRIGAASGM